MVRTEAFDEVQKLVQNVNRNQTSEDHAPALFSRIEMMLNITALELDLKTSRWNEDRLQRDNETLRKENENLCRHDREQQARMREIEVEDAANRSRLRDERQKVNEILADAEKLDREVRERVQHLKTALAVVMLSRIGNDTDP